MYRLLFTLSLIAVIVTFGLFLFSLMQFFPRALAGLLLFLSILLTVIVFNERNRFKGWD